MHRINLPALLQQAPSSRARTIALMVLAMIFLQKLGLTIGNGSIGLNTFVLFSGTIWLLLHAEGHVVTSRLALFILLLLLIVTSLAFGPGTFRVTAVAVLLISYSPLIISCAISRMERNFVIEIFQAAMLIIAGVVILQQAAQYTVGNAYWPNMERFVPSALLYPGFAYIRPYSWDSPYLTPNGFFFLEPSVLSYYLAVSLAFELLWFDRIGRILFLTTALLAAVAATGPVALAAVAPAIVWRMSRRMKIMAVAVVVPLLAAMILSTGGRVPLLSRSGELTDSQSSGYARIMLPLQSMAQDLGRPDMALTGAGPGQSPRAANLVQWPFSKLLYEYGLLVAIVFHLYLFVALLGSPPDRLIVVMMLVPYLFFGGGFVSPASVMPLAFFGSLMARSPQPARPAAGLRPRPSSPLSPPAVSA